MSLPVIAICTAAYHTDVNRVWDAMGRGPGNFSRRLTGDVDPSPDSTVTHYLLSDTSTSIEEVATWQALAGGTLPDISPRVWGEDGIITAMEATLAVNGFNLQVYSASGEVEPTDHAAGVLTSRMLTFVPDPEI